MPRFSVLCDWRWHNPTPTVGKGKAVIGLRLQNSSRANALVAFCGCAVSIRFLFRFLLPGVEFAPELARKT
jgi:hypothetical protein